MKLLILSSLIFSFASVSQATQYAWDNHKRGSDFTRYTQDALDDYGDFLLDTRESANLKATGNICPNYNNMNTRERREFYTALVAEIALHESSFREGIIGDESKFKGGNLKGFSMGFMQLEYGKAKNSYKCDEIKNKHSLLDARINIRCAVKMMNHLVKRDQVLRTDTDKVGSLLIKGQNKLRTEDTSDLKWEGVSDFWSSLRFEFWRDRAKLSRPYFSKGNKDEKAKARSVEKTRTTLSNKPYCKR